MLAALHSIAGKHGVTIPAVATRHVLDVPGVASVIVGSRLAPSESDGSASISASTTTKTQTTNTYIDANLAAFTFTLDEDDRRAIKDAQAGLGDLPGDCGDEYRYPPYLTASGDLGDHLAEADTAAQRDMAAQVEQTIREGGRVEKSSGSPWEPVAVRIGDTDGHMGRGTPLPLLFSSCGEGVVVLVPSLMPVVGILPRRADWRPLCRGGHDDARAPVGRGCPWRHVGRGPDHQRF